MKLTTKTKALIVAIASATVCFSTVCSVQSKDGEEHSRSYGEWVITASPNCKQYGSRERICPECNDKQTETLQRLGHSLDVWIKEESRHYAFRESGLEKVTISYDPERRSA